MSEEVDKGGRPLKFGSVEELDKSIEEFFAKPEEEWTITGLALHLDTFRDVLDDYASGKYDSYDPRLSNSIKRAKARVVASYEHDLKKKGHAGLIFGLKNIAGWKDKQEIDVAVRPSMEIE